MLGGIRHAALKRVAFERHQEAARRAALKVGVSVACLLGHVLLLISIPHRLLTNSPSTGKSLTKDRRTCSGFAT